MAWLTQRIHLTFGRREWEIQAVKDGHLDNYSGPPYLTKGEAKRALKAWKWFDFWDEAKATNVRTGEKLRG